MRISTPIPVQEQISCERTAAVAGRIVRSLVVEHARRRDRAVALHEALEALGRIDSRKARVAELVYFAGLSSCEIASALRVPSATVARDWRIARCWLRQRLAKPSSGCRSCVGQSSVG